MIEPVNNRMTRIAVFIDGGYFDQVGKYYKFNHPRNSRLSINGLQEYIRRAVAEYEHTHERCCQIVEAHYFRGRFSAEDTEAANKLKEQAAFDDVLIKAGVIQHYLPLKKIDGYPQEMGIDVWLSLEAFDLAVHRRFDICALVTCDSDYLPLVRKLNGIGTRTMLLAWDFQYEFTDRYGRKQFRGTRTARSLIDACTYPLMMAEEIDEETRGSEAVNSLFVDQWYDPGEYTTD